MRVSDRDAFRTARAITRQEGILVGGSSGTAVVAALTVAAELPAGTTMVVILPDTGRNYLSKLYSDTWMLQYGLMERPEIVRVEEVLSAKHGRRPAARHRRRAREGPPGDRPSCTSSTSRRRPSSGRTAVDVAQFVGASTRRSLLDRIFRDPDALQADVAEVMGAAVRPWSSSTRRSSSRSTSSSTVPAVLVAKAGQALGVLTRTDLLEFLAHRSRV